MAGLTTSLTQANLIAERLHTGVVSDNVDDAPYCEQYVSFGGMTGKRSGTGRFGGKHTVMEMTAPCTITTYTGMR